MKREDFVFSVALCLTYNLLPPAPPPPLPQIKDGKITYAFWLLHGFILDLGEWGFAVPFYIPSKIVGLPRRLDTELQLLTDVSYKRLHCAFSVRM